MRKANFQGKEIEISDILQILRKFVVGIGSGLRGCERDFAGFSRRRWGLQDGLWRCIMCFCYY